MSKILTPSPALVQAMTAAGFTLQSTGGGCDAWIRENGHEQWGGFGSVWITEGDDPSAPLTLNAPATLGVYGTEDSGGAPIALFLFPNVRTALRWLVSNARPER